MELADLHALLEHFEEVHVVVLDSPSLRPTTTARSSAESDMSMDDDDDDDDSTEPQSAFDPDAMDLDSGPSSSSGSTPPSTPPIDITGALINSASTLFDNNNLVIRTSSRALSKAAASGSMSGYNTPRGISPHPTTPGAERSEASLFNPYASYSDFSALMPGTVRTPTHQSPPPNAIKGDPNSPTLSSNSANHLNNNGNPTVLTSIPPALLFSPSTQTTPNGSPMQSRTGTPTPSGGLSRAGSLNGGVTSASLMSLANANHGASGTAGGGASSGKKGSISGVSGSHYPHSPSTPGASTSSSSASNGGGNGGSLVAKPFRCPTVGCNKSYKQANGLKYHITHGQCNFMPRDPALDGLNESEADEKARPYVCQVGPCTRRYKNMNGLREYFFLPLISHFYSFVSGSGNFYVVQSSWTLFSVLLSSVPAFRMRARGASLLLLERPPIVITPFEPLSLARILCSVSFTSCRPIDFTAFSPLGIPFIIMLHPPQPPLPSFWPPPYSNHNWCSSRIFLRTHHAHVSSFDSFPFPLFLLVVCSRDYYISFILY